MSRGMSDGELAIAKLAIKNQSRMGQKEAKAVRVRESIERVVALSIILSIGLTLFLGSFLLLVAVILFWGMSIVIYIVGKRRILNRIRQNQTEKFRRREKSRGKKFS
ncbi:MAG: hypothetical protein GY742_11785 [Hyphomicrobiales bacterium]|nr:hypothetical protein [Hyphomicrobiales bacterium]